MSRDLIAFNAADGEKLLKVELSQSSGGGGSYGIYIDGLWYGSLNYRSGRWVALPHQQYYFMRDDIDALLEIMERERPDGK